jgi:hypothetical protein
MPSTQPVEARRNFPELPAETRALLDECRRLSLELIGNDSDQSVNLLLLAYVNVLRRSIVRGMVERDPVSDSEIAAELRRFVLAREM